MIKLTAQGKYVLAETFGHTKILTLDNEKKFAWINAEGIGEILVASKKVFAAENILAMGNYRFYKVKKESRLTDLSHLELSVGQGRWQGYLLPIGLPNGNAKRKIVPTNEVITKTIF